MSSNEELNEFKQKCKDLLQNLRQIKKVDKDTIDQMNQNVSSLGCSINNFILKDDDSHKDLIAEVIDLYEKTTQNLDNIIYKHKGIHEHLLSGFKSQIQRPIDETAWDDSEPQKEIAQLPCFNHLEKLNVLEDTNIEFKNYTIDSFNQRATRLTFKKTIVSFLNRSGGCIYIGIRDDTTIVGMKLNHAEMDILKRRIITIKSGIAPSMNEKVKVDFIPIKQGQRWYKGHWIVRVRVQQGDLNTLYYFENQQDPYYLESYFREDGAVVRYKINDFIEEKIAISQNRNPKSRILVKKEYCQPDQEGFQACMVWNNDIQHANAYNNNNHYNKNINNNVFRNDMNAQQQQKNLVYLGQFQMGNQQQYKNEQKEDINQIKYEDNNMRKKNANNKDYQKNPAQNQFRMNQQKNPFMGININENDLDDIADFNQIENEMNQQKKDAEIRRNQFRENKNPLQINSSPFKQEEQMNKIQQNQNHFFDKISIDKQIKPNNQQVNQFDNQSYQTMPFKIQNEFNSNSPQKKIKDYEKLENQNSNSNRQNNRYINKDNSASRSEEKPKQNNIQMNNLQQIQSFNQPIQHIQKEQHLPPPQNNKPIIHNPQNIISNAQQSQQPNQNSKQQVQKKPNSKRFGAIFYETLYGQNQN